MFNEKETDVLLISKLKPNWQKGKINGIGGKIEFGESAKQAMAREFEEETGIQTKPESWKPVITMNGFDWLVDVFTCKSDEIFNAKTCEIEEVVWLSLDALNAYPLIDNLYWLIPMCLDGNINYSLKKQIIFTKQ